MNVEHDGKYSVLRAHRMVLRSKDESQLFCALMCLMLEGNVNPGVDERAEVTVKGGNYTARIYKV